MLPSMMPLAPLTSHLGGQVSAVALAPLLAGEPLAEPLAKQSAEPTEGAPVPRTYPMGQAVTARLAELSTPREGRSGERETKAEDRLACFSGVGELSAHPHCELV